MELERNQYVLFENGRKEGFYEARWSDKYQAFFTFTDDNQKLFSTTIIDKPQRKSPPRSSRRPLHRARFSFFPVARMRNAISSRMECTES